jgi:hypothetical protein
MMEQYVSSKGEYRYEEHEDINDKNNYGANRRGLDQLLALEEIVDNTLTYYVKNSDEATSLLKKCVRMMDDKQWNTMQTYLESIGNIFPKKSRKFENWTK